MASLTKTAKIAGILHLLLLPFGLFSFVYIPLKFFGNEDISLTIQNISDNILLFRLSSISHLLSQIIVVFLALKLFQLFKNVNRNKAILMLILTLLVVPISSLNEVHNLGIIKLINTESDLGQLNTLVTMLLDLSRNGVVIAQIFWGLWLIPLGLLVQESAFIPKIIGLFVIIAGVAYLFDSIIQLLTPGFIVFSQFTFILEITFPIWLVIKGIKD